MAHVQGIKTRDALNNSVTVIKDGAVHEKAPGDRFQKDVPDFIKHLPEPERERVAAEIENFWALLPREGDSPARNYVLQHFVEIPPDGRRELIRYINNLPEDNAQRDEELAYLEYWNVDRAKAYRTGSNNFSVWFHVTDPTQMAVIHGGVIVLIVLFTAGLFTRVTSVLVWVACVGYIHGTQRCCSGWTR
jgi:hypothetical protein